MAEAGQRKPRTKSVIEMPPASPVASSAFTAALPIVAPIVDPEPAPLAEPAAAPASHADQPEVAPVPVAAALDAALPADVPPITAAPIVPETSQKDNPMTETYTTAADAMKNGAEQMKATMATTTESAMATGKATFEQAATKSREAIETGMKNVDEFAGLARGNVEAMLASSRAAAQGIEAIAREVADFSRKTFEETTAAARAMTTVKTPNELMQLQNDFAKTQFDAAVAEMSKLSETMVKLMGEVFEPMQARATVATDKLKSMAGTVGQ